MAHLTVEALLILQDRDVKRLALEAQLKAVPRDIALVEQRIAAEKAAIGLRYAVTLKNKVLEAYRELMNTPV